jgi:hypothetical protein
MGFIYFVYKYNMIYSYDSDIDTKGLLYPNALLHLIVGLYMAELCLIGLFGLHAAIGPLLLMVLFMIFTALVHISLSDALGPLLNNLPRTLALQDESLVAEDIPVEETNNTTTDGAPAAAQGGSAAEYYNMEEGFGMDDQPGATSQGGAAADYYNTGEDFGMDPNPNPGQGTELQTTRGVEGADGFLSTLGTFASTIFSNKLNVLTADQEESPLTHLLHRLMNWITPDPTKKPNFLLKFLHPEVFDDYHILRQMLPTESPPTDCPEYMARRGYYPPEMWMPPPRLWIPQDEARVSRQEVAHSKDVVGISDRGAWLDEKGRVVADMDAAPFREQRVLY